MLVLDIVIFLNLFESGKDIIFDCGIFIIFWYRLLIINIESYNIEV